MQYLGRIIYKYFQKHLMVQIYANLQCLNMLNVVKETPLIFYTFKYHIVLEDICTAMNCCMNMN